MNAMPSHRNAPSRADVLPRRRRPCGFSITELLVVIGIIALLVSLLLVALDAVQTKARTVKTQARMEGFARACDAFQMEHGYYPGAVPEEILANDPQISGTENALLHLMGGVVREADVTSQEWNSLQPATPYTQGWETVSFAEPGGGTYRIKIKVAAMGEGPTIEGKPYAPYFSPGTGELGMVDAQWSPNPFATPDGFPDLLDAWGQPITYIRRIRTIGPVAGDRDSTTPPQFRVEGLHPYTKSVALGEYRMQQAPAGGGYASSEPGGAWCVLNCEDFSESATLAQIIRHPAFGDANDPLKGTPRGAYILFSAGPDGIYFSRKDGPGKPTAPADDLLSLSPKVVEEYDDVIVAGGG